MTDATVYRRSLLVDAGWLWEHRGEPWLRIIDCGASTPAWDPDATATEEHGRGHIPGALPLNVHNWVKEPSAPLHVLGPEGFARAMGRLGVSRTTTVVAYDRAHSLCASRLWWAFTYYGHRDVRVLDGGLDAWIGAGLPTTTQPAAAAPALFVPRRRAELICGIDELRRRLQEPAFLTADIRTDGEYAGTDARGNRWPGHIPGAVHLDWPQFLTDDGLARFRPAGELRDLARRAGISPGDEVVTYCQVGVRAALGALALTVAGWPRVRVYDASMAEWANRDDTPLHATTPAGAAVARLNEGVNA